MTDTATKTAAMSDASFETILIDNRKRKRAELQQKLGRLMAEWTDHVLDLHRKSAAVSRAIDTIADYDAYVWERRSALFIARVLEPVDLDAEPCRALCSASRSGAPSRRQ